MKQFFLLFLILVLSLELYAQDKRLLQNPIYVQLLKDFPAEVSSGEFVSKDSGEARNFIEKWNAYVSGASDVNPTLTEKGLPWHNIWPPKPAVVQNVSPRGPPQLEKITVVDISKKPHSMPDPQLYAKNRLGSEAYDLISSKKVSAMVYAGFESSFLQDQSLKFEKIPSLFEEWGITKYVAFPAGKKPVLAFVVPPIKQYAHHYASMFGIAGDTGAEVILNQTDRAEMKNIIGKQANDIISRIKTKVDYLVVGYQNQWESILEENSHEWRVKSLQKLPAMKMPLYDPKMTTKVITLSKISDPKVTMSIVSIGAETTIWGEATANMVTPFLKLKPQAVYFGGSAGGLESSLPTYSASIPKRFMVDTNLLKIENSLDNIIKTGVDSRNVTVEVTEIHGTSNSPAEQTLEYIQKRKNLGITSLDVEQSLLAQAIDNFNSTSVFQQIDFRAANLITDKPGVLEEVANLDTVDSGKKAKARLTILENIYTSSTKDFETRNAHLLGKVEATGNIEELDNIRKQMIKKAFPGVTDENIFIKNGIGRVDVNPKVKFSYYIFTDEPHKLNGKTVLIPMATSRYTPTYYQTDDWWDENKEAIDRAKAEGTPMPRQDAEEVKAWLKENNLSTNPDVFSFNTQEQVLSNQKLQDFLLDYYIKKNAVNGKIVLYRGAEKLTEIGEWEQGIRPRGVRYWTPDITYAWRYGRKHAEFLSGMLTDKTPILKYEMTVAEFTDMVKNRELNLGTELTKKVHDNFDRTGRFLDQLQNNSDYMGDGIYGVEIEARANRSGSNKFTQFYKGPVTYTELIEGFKNNVHVGISRLMLQYPERVDELLQLEKTRVANLNVEKQILDAIKRGESQEVIQALNNKLTQYQITNFDAKDFKSLALEISISNLSCDDYFKK